MKIKDINFRKLKTIFNKLDIFSKLLLVLMLLLVFVVGFNFIGNLRFSSPAKILEVDTVTGIEVSDYYFESGTKIRWPSDNYLVITLSKVLSEEEKNKINLRIQPEQRFDIEIKENNLFVKFLEQSPRDLIDREVIILYSDKQIGRITYTTSDTETTGVDYDINDLNRPRKDQ